MDIRVELQIPPSHQDRFDYAERMAIWFVAKLNGYDTTELDMFTDIIYRYLNKYFSDKYYINKSFCVEVDVVSGRKVTYSSLEDESVPMLLEETISEINRL